MTAADAEPPPRPASTRRHRVHRFLGRLHEVLDDLGTDSLWALTPDELAECLQEVFSAQARLAALSSGLVVEADRTDLAARQGSVNLVAWLREHARLAPAAARQQVRLAHGLEKRPVVRAALASGGFPAASAAVIVEALEALPDEVDPAVREHAETYLADEAHVHDTAVLRRLAAHLDEVIDPDGADARLAEQLARAEARAARTTFLHLHHHQATATTEGAFRLPLVQGLKLHRMIESLLNPGRPEPTIGSASPHPSLMPAGDPGADPGTRTQFTAEERRGRAFAELLDRVPTGRLPQVGGSDPRVVVTMSLQALMGGLEAAQVDTGHAISAGAARRLAAQAGVIPAVLGNSSEVLDLGRKVRFFTKKQRLAMLVQQHGTCAVQVCQRPAIWGDAHHLIPWHRGGPTDLADGVLICPRHHTLADHPDYEVTRLRPGRIAIHRRC